MNQWDDVMMPNYGSPSLQLVEGSGSHVKATDGRTYLDLIGGIAVQTVGHGNPAVVEAVVKQMQTLQHTSNLYAHEPGITLATMLQKRTYGYQVLFLNSGTEANETALKLVRNVCQDNPDSIVLAFNGSFHGRTTGSLALTGQTKHQRGFGPLPTQILHIPFNDPAALETALQENDIGAIFFEPIQGESGIVPMTQEMAAALHRAQEHGTILVADEVQTGIGRTGTFWAHEQYQLQPDVITTAKALGAGLPLGACLVHPRLAQHLGPGSHGCTFGGNPVSAAASIAMLQELDSQDLLRQVTTLGQKVEEKLTKSGKPFRGRGLLWAIPTANAARVANELQEQGVLVGTAGDAIRIAPPFTVPEIELMHSLDLIIDAVRPTQ